jgi:hypothetical protein
MVAAQAVAVVALRPEMAEPCLLHVENFWEPAAALALIQLQES